MNNRRSTIEQEDEIILKREKDILESIENEEKFWKGMTHVSMKNAWSKEDKIWNKLAKEDMKY